MLIIEDRNRRLKQNNRVTAICQSNRKLVHNALQVCLAGSVNETNRNEVLDILEQSEEVNFLILFRDDKNHSYKGLYHNLLDGNPATKLHGTGPAEIALEEVSDFFKYDSGAKIFKPIPTKSFSAFVHGIALSRLPKFNDTSHRGRRPPVRK
jgi:hypothetical protein